MRTNWCLWVENESYPRCDWHWPLCGASVTRLFSLGMALQMSALFSYVRVPLYTTVPLPRVRADIQRAGIKFKHILTSGSSQLGGKPATSPVRGHITAAPRGDKFSTTTATAALWSRQGSGPSSSPRGRAGWLGRVALGAALGVSAAALVKSLHTGTLAAAMALKVNLNSTEGDWKETKGETVKTSPRRLYFSV